MPHGLQRVSDLIAPMKAITFPLAVCAVVLDLTTFRIIEVNCNINKSHNTNAASNKKEKKMKKEKKYRIAFQIYFFSGRREINVAFGYGCMCVRVCDCVS